jgi:ribosomal protein S18 acetylase RimI-like enzyme
MLKLLYGINELNFRQLMDVYEETNRANAERDYPNEHGELGLLFAEQDFYQYLELFFECPGAIYAVWDDGERYKAALRLERYRDGVIITALEVLPAFRRMGVGNKLVKTVTELSHNTCLGPIYSHVKHDNIASLAIHRNCGFEVVANDAVFLDGSRHNDHFTLVFK